MIPWGPYGGVERIPIEQQVMTRWIYQLVDPRNGEPFYVGHTNWPRRRLLTHISHGIHFVESEYRTATYRKSKKIHEMLSENVEPEIEILDVVFGTRSIAQKLEYKWIQRISKDYLLVNER